MTVVFSAFKTALHIQKRQDTQTERRAMCDYPFRNFVFVYFENCEVSLLSKTSNFRLQNSFLHLTVYDW
jgi:hypothetical protein